MQNLGDFTTADILYVPFDTYDADGASVTISGLAVTDIEIYKNGSTTQRASDNGYALLDTDGIDFDGSTGLHGFSIDLSDNSDASFYSAGAQYWIHVNAITVNAQTVKFTYIFTIGRLLKPTTAGRTLDVSAGGEAGVDWANVGSPTTVVGLSGTTVKTATDVETDTADIQSRLPAALTAGGNMKSDALAISGDTVAADALESIFEGGSADITLSTLTVTNFNVGQDINIGRNLDITSDLTVGGISTLPWNAAWDAEVQSECADALVAYDGVVPADLPSNFAALGINASGHVSRVVLVDTLTTYTGNTPQTADHTASVAAILADTGTDGVVVASHTAAAKTEINAEVLDVLNVDTFAEPTGVPAATTTLAGKIGRLYQALRNKLTTTSAKKIFYDDAEAALWEKDIADDGTTYSETEGNAP
jgi:hypothetical protein